MSKIREKADENLPEFASKYLNQLNEIQQEQIQDRINTLKSKYNSIAFLKGEKSKENIDDMFYSFEELPPFGKEYWFFNFTSTEEKDNRQLLSMFGKPKNRLKVNGTSVEGENSYLMSWFYDGSKESFEGSCSIKTNEKDLLAKKEDSSALFSGSLGSHEFKLKVNGKNVAELNLAPDVNMQNPYSFGSYFKAFAGFSLINLYLDAKGELNGRSFEGKTYAQKVIVIGPLVPWYWGRIVFGNGSVLTYYLPKVDLRYFNFPLLKKLKVFNAVTGKEHTFDGLEVEKTRNGYKVSNRDDEIEAEIETYSSQDFSFENIGSFDYTEYLGKIKNIDIEGVDEEKLGDGVGTVEEANGYTL